MKKKKLEVVRFFSH